MELTDDIKEALENLDDPINWRGRTELKFVMQAKERLISQPEYFEVFKILGKLELQFYEYKDELEAVGI